eukprot:gene15158-biopygen20162
MCGTPIASAWNAQCAMSAAGRGARAPAAAMRASLCRVAERLATPLGHRTLARAWRGHGAGVARACPVTTWTGGSVPRNRPPLVNRQPCTRPACTRHMTEHPGPRSAHAGHMCCQPVDKRAHEHM